MTQLKYIEKGDCHILLEGGKFVMSYFSRNSFQSVSNHKCIKNVQNLDIEGCMSQKFNLSLMSTLPTFLCGQK